MLGNVESFENLSWQEPSGSMVLPGALLDFGKCLGPQKLVNNSVGQGPGFAWDTIGSLGP